MKIMAARQAPIEQVEAFIQTAEDFNTEGLLKEGYVVEIEGKINGCFILSTMGKDIYWLKQLYIAKESAGHLPVLLESILQMTKQKHAKKLYVQSHQPVVDLLLEALQFYPQTKEELELKDKKKVGNWWAYQVS